MASGRPTILVQLSDPHVVARGELLFDLVDTAALLRAAVEHVNALVPPPDLAILTGDLTAYGSLAEYEHVAELLAPLEVPYVVLPGNHDLGDALAEVFPRPDSGVTEDVGWQHVVEVGPLRLVVLDSSVPDSPAGCLGPARLAWLDDVLGASSTPTVVAVHHPPFPTGVQHMDSMNLEDGAALGAVVERHPHVVRVICGHVHRPVTTGWHGTVVTIAPSTAHQVALDLTDGEARWRREPPGVQLHVWLPDEQLLVTHTSTIGDYGPIERFEESVT